MRGLGSEVFPTLALCSLLLIDVRPFCISGSKGRTADLCRFGAQLEKTPLGMHRHFMSDSCWVFDEEEDEEEETGAEGWGGGVRMCGVEMRRHVRVCVCVYVSLACYCQCLSQFVKMKSRTKSNGVIASGTNVFQK